MEGTDWPEKNLIKTPDPELLLNSSFCLLKYSQNMDFKTKRFQQTTSWRANCNFFIIRKIIRSKTHINYIS